ncbi:MAG: HlyD family efflux transporter periplasmic adaptor subunit [Planctomycetes bacterium]|nr:HlyD family efflux transporter periplasmic adaptor subunit [Planctomycetota bacterium]
MRKLASALVLLMVIGGMNAAQEARGEPEPLTGQVQPAQVTELKLELKGYSGELKLKTLLAPGTSVKKGDVVAEVEGTELADALERAGESVELARGSVAHLQAALEHADESFKLQHERAKRSAERAQQDLEFFIQHDKAESIRNSEMGLENYQNNIEDQEEELAQLERLYQGNDLAKESQDIVLNRSKRRLKQTKERYEMSKKDHERLVNVHMKRREQDLVSARDQAVLELARLDGEAERGNLDLGGKLTRARRGLKDAEKSLADLQGDQARMKLTAPHDGLVAVGAWGGNDGASNPFKVGDDVKNRATLATVVNTGRLKVEVSVKLDSRAKFPAGQPVNVTAKEGATTATGKVTAIGFVVNRGMVTASIEIDNPEGKLLPGQKVGVALPE